MDDETLSFLTLPEASRQFGIGLGTLKAHAARGSFPTYRLGTRWRRVKRSELLRWVNSRRVSVNGNECVPDAGDPRSVESRAPKVCSSGQKAGGR